MASSEEQFAALVNGVTFVGRGIDNFNYCVARGTGVYAIVGAVLNGTRGGIIAGLEGLGAGGIGRGAATGAAEGGVLGLGVAAAFQSASCAGNNKIFEENVAHVIGLDPECRKLRPTEF